MDAVDDYGHEVVQLEGDPAYPISEGDIRNALHLSVDFFEEEMSFLSGNLGQCISISIDLSGDGIFRMFLSMVFRFHFNSSLQ